MVVRLLCGRELRIDSDEWRCRQIGVDSISAEYGRARARCEGETDEKGVPLLNEESLQTSSGLPRVAKPRSFDSQRIATAGASPHSLVRIGRQVRWEPGT